MFSHIFHIFIVIYNRSKTGTLWTVFLFYQYDNKDLLALIILHSSRIITIVKLTVINYIFCITLTSNRCFRLVLSN